MLTETSLRVPGCQRAVGATRGPGDWFVSTDTAIQTGHDHIRTPMLLPGTSM